MDKLNKEMERLKGELKQSQTKLEEAREGAVEIAAKNSKTTVEEFKTSNGLQEYLHSYRVDTYNITCEDFRKYLKLLKEQPNKLPLKFLFHCFMMLLLLLS